MADHIQYSISKITQMVQQISSQLTQVEQQNLQTTGSYTIYEINWREESLFLRCYDHVSHEIIYQQHYNWDQVRQGDQSYRTILTEIISQLISKNSVSFIYLLNIGTQSTNLNYQDIQYVLNHLKSSNVRLIVNLHSSIDPTNDFQNFTCIQWQEQEYAITLVEEDLKSKIVDIKLYEDYIIKNLQKLNDCHEQFTNNFADIYELVESSQIDKEIVKYILGQQLEYADIYLTGVINNIIVKYSFVNPILLIQNIQQYIKNQFILQNNQIKRKLSEIPPLLIRKLYLFKTPQYRHFPIKQLHSQKCRVCLKLNEKVKKSKYRCQACSQYYHVNVTLCVISCFKMFHQTPEYYLKRKTKQAIKYEEI